MKATGSKLHKVQETIDTQSGMKGEVYYDYERSLYTVFINCSLMSEHETEEDALDDMHAMMED